jgi:putative membrane protein
MPFYAPEGWWLFPLVMPVVMIAAMVVMVLLMRDGMPGMRRHDRTPREPDALEILRRRLAAGEISEEEFERRRELLDR